MAQIYIDFIWLPGLGSRLCETIRELYPMNYILSCVVAPHVSGESPLQHYNSLLCLASLQKLVHLNYVHL